MLKVQKAIKPIPKDETNPAFKNNGKVARYFDINSVVAMLRPVLNEAGLVVTQGLDGGNIVTTVADPDSGEERSWSFPIPAMQDVQKLGGAITYLRRYSLVSLFLLEAEDDDGNHASQVAPTAQNQPVQASKPTAPVQAQLGTKVCPGCGKSWTPKASYETTCYPCYLKAKDAPATTVGQEYPPDDGFDKLSEIPF